MADEPHPPVELFRRLPTTCGPALNDQFREWNLLFPAEQHRLDAQAAQRVACYPGSTVTLFAAWDSNRPLMLGPPGYAKMATQTPVAAIDLSTQLVRWLASGA
jgi:hypothetical protein